MLVGLVAFGAYLAGIVHRENMAGIAVSAVFTIVTCLPFFPVMKAAAAAGRMGSVAVFDRLCGVLGYTGVLYSLGGFEATYLAPVYIVYLTYCVVATERKLPYVTATMSFLSFSAVVVLEHLRLIPHLGVLRDYNPPFRTQLASLGTTGVLLYVSAFVAATASRAIEKGRAELERAKDKAMESDRRKSEFLANMSHELRTPLNHIIGFTELVREEAAGQLGEPQQEALGDVLKSGRHLLSLINDILDISKVEAGKQDLVLEQADVGMLLRESVRVVADGAQKAGVALEVEVGDIAQRIRVDVRKINQVLYNLLSNAVKFTPQGGRVRLICAPDGPSRLALSVSDTGVGLGKEELERVFQPFERGGAAGRSPGTGLGLAVARKLVELHGGRIWAESDGEGKGSTFHFWLPVR
jgi:signal transduction histidine kinase